MASTHYRNVMPMAKSEYERWEAAGLKDFGDYADMVEYVNCQDSGYGDEEGEWWYADDDRRVVYSGTFGNDHSPGTDVFADVYDTEDEYREAVAEWEAKPEYVESEDDEDEDDDEEEPSLVMPPGYCFEYIGSGSQWANGGDPELWETVVYTTTEDEYKVGETTIDGTRCVVFFCPLDGKYRAVNRVNVT